MNGRMRIFAVGLLISSMVVLPLEAQTRAPEQWAIPTDVTPTPHKPFPTPISLAKPAPQEKGDLLHLVAVTSKPPSPYAHLWHTIRFTSEYTWQDFRDVERVAGPRGDFVDVDSAAVGTDLHVLGITSDGKLWHTIRSKAGWQELREVASAVSGPRSFTRVAAATVGNDVHVLVIDAEKQNLWHTIRYGNNTWQNFFGDVLRVIHTPEDGDAKFIDVAAAGVRQELHVALVNSSKNLYHTIRWPHGWQAYPGPVRKTTATPIQGAFTRVAAGEANGAIHLCMVMEGGALLHTVRHANAWERQANNITALTKSGAGLKFTDVSCRSLASQLHVAAVTTTGGLWHTIRHLATPSWDRLGNVEESAAGERGTITAVAISGMRVP